MQYDNIDLHSLKKVKYFNPLFKSCHQAFSSSSQTDKKSNSQLPQQNNFFRYIVIDQISQIPSQIFQCKTICPILKSNKQSFILVKGDNLWDYYRANKAQEVILTQQQIWVLIKQITQSLLHLLKFGYHHTHLKQYAICRLSSFSYQLIFHPQIKSMLQLSLSNQFYWYDFYLSPQQLNASSKQIYQHTEKDSVFSLGLLILNVMNVEDFNRDVYSKRKYQIDWDIVFWKLNNARQKKRYSKRLVSLIQNCLKQFSAQRYGFHELYEQAINFISFNKSKNIQFKMKINQMLRSKLKSSSLKKEKQFEKSDSIKNKKSSSSGKKIQQNQQKKSQKKSQKSLETSNKKSLEKSQQNKSQKSKSSQRKQNQKINSQKQRSYQSVKVKKWKDFLQQKNKIRSNEQLQQQKYNSTKRNRYLQINLQQKQNNQGNYNFQQENVKQFRLTEDEINFERGTFGGQLQSPKFQNLFINKLKSFTQNQKQGIKNHNSNLNQKIKENSSKKQQQQQNNLLQIKKQKQGYPLKEKNQIKFQNIKYERDFDKYYPIDSKQILAVQSQKSLSKNKQQQNSKLKAQTQGTKLNQNHKQQIPHKITVQQIRIKQSQFLQIYSQIDNFNKLLTLRQKDITLDLQFCLQPFQNLQTTISSTPGIYMEGNVYYGPFNNGRRNGFGLQMFPQNQYYLGNFKDDLFHGEGFYYWNKNEYFLGIFQNGKKVFGYLYGSKLNYFGQFKESKKMSGIGRAVFKNQQVYVGRWKDGRRHGIGQIIQITKDRYIGQWVKGIRNGYGQHISSQYPNEGYKLKGVWRNHDLISEAVIEYCNGNIYEGDLKDFQKHGKGVYRYKKGGYFKGTFYKNEATHGQLMYKNGQKYIGSLRNMKRHGFGEYHYEDGGVKKGNWIEDVRVEKDTYQLKS